MKIRAYAKINLALDVVGERPDGYHNLDMIMAPIDLHDLIYIDKIQEGIVITSNNYRIPTDKRNIMYRAAELLISYFHLDSGVKIHLYKHIPVQAGLGGGSADGAAVLKAMNQMFHLGLSLKQLASIGKTIGSDIPFCIYNKIALVQGIGDRLTFIDNDFQSYVMLVKPKMGVSTQKCYKSVDEKTDLHPDIEAMRQGILTNDYNKVIDNLGNTLEGPSIRMVSEIEEIKKDLLRLGFDGALMTGSGSCVFGLTRDKQLMKKSYDYLKNKYYYTRFSQILGKP